MVLNIISSFLEPFPAIWVDVKEGSDAAKESKKYKPIAEVQLKKVTNALWESCNIWV